MNIKSLKATIIFLVLAASGTMLAQPTKSGREIVYPKNAASPNRTALVIGNGDYQSVSRLNNAVKDARDVSKALRELGFEVIGGENQSAEEMKRSILSFGERLSAKKGIGVFYYAGHGVQLSGRNYLIPVEANALREQTIEFEAVDVNRVLAEMDAAENNLNLVILDACRNNPFTRSWRSGTEGLASINAPSGTLIAYATAPGEVASDGGSANGLYTAALLKWMREPDLKVEEMFKKVRVDVAKESQNKQIPWESSSLQGDFYFNPKFIKQLVADAVKNSPANSDDGLKVKVNPVSGARPKYKGTLLNFLFETPLLTGADANLIMQKREVSYFDENLDENAKLEMLEIRGGNFTMGSTADEARKAWQKAVQQYETQTQKKAVAGKVPYDNYAVETPARTVNVRPFFMSRYEITQRQWKAVMGSLPKKLLETWDDFRNDDYPVIYVSWNEAKDFCRQLSKKTGKKYRLPSEAEWEYAARAGTTTAYAFGETVDLTLVNFGHNNGFVRPDMTVTRLFPNAFGLFHLHGNVDEWCEDVWNPNYRNAPTDGSARKDGADQKVGVIRGGNFYNYAIDCRSASRDDFPREESSNSLGFRVVAEIQ